MAIETDDRNRAITFMTRRNRLRWYEALPWIAAIGVFFVFPHHLNLGTQTLIMALFALSLDLIVGYAGLVTLGQAAYFGVGAYTVALLASRWNWGEPISALAAGAAVAGLVGFATGWILLRYRGLTLLVLTLGTAIILQQLANLFSNVTGGYDGLPGLAISPVLGLFHYDLYDRTAYLYSLAVLFSVFFVLRRIVISSFGATLVGIRENTARMHAIGSPVHWRLVAAYSIAAALSGIAGALFVQTNAYVTLGVFGFKYSAGVIVMLILGGPGRLYGALAGAVIYMILENYLSKLSPAFWHFGIGLLLVLTVMFARRGLFGVIESAPAFFSRIFARKKAK